jgi:AcrR family transcriptional regulator
VRRTQEERSAETRSRLLDATIECLIDRGYAGTTTTVVSERAGVSRGAQLHHFPTKAELVIQAVGRLAQRRADELRRDAASLPSGGARLDGVLEKMWTSFSGPLFTAALELWVAARTDPELHESLYRFERQMGRSMAQLWRELGAPAVPRFEELAELTLHLLRGMALQRILRDDDKERRRQFDLWKTIVIARTHEGATR